MTCLKFTPTAVVLCYCVIFFHMEMDFLALSLLISVSWRAYEN